MNIYKKLESEHSAECRDAIINYVGKDLVRFEKLMDCFLSEEWRICQRAAWPLGYIGSDHPELLDDYHKMFIDVLKRSNSHDAVIRNILRIYDNISIPEKIQGSLFDVSMDLALDSKKPIAVRAFSLGVIASIAEGKPELAEEILIILEEFPGELSAGLKNRLGKVKAKLQKILKPLTR